MVTALLLVGCASGSSGNTDGTGSSASPSGAGGTGPFANAPAGSGSGGGAAGAVSTDPHGCNDLLVQFNPVIPTVLLLVDRSGSMWDFTYGASPTRWEAVYDGVMSPDIGVLQALEHEVRFGLMTYTSDGDSHTCPVLSSVAPALDNFAAIQMIYDQASTRPAFKAETPTGEGIRAATTLLGALDPDAEPGPKVMVLITDGEPDTCATPDPQCGQDESISGLQTAFAQGIRTFVIGISSDVGRQHLQDLANAGSGQPVQPPSMQFMYDCVNPGRARLDATYAAAGEAPGTAPVHQPGDRDAIASTLRSVIRGVHGCSYELQGEVDLEKAHLGRVQLDGTSVSYDDPNGWRMQDTRTLELLGTACEQLQTEASELVISFPCDAVDVL